MCFVLDVANQTEYSCHWFVMSCAIVLMIFCLYRLLVLRTIKTIAKYITIVHLLLLFWGLSNESSYSSCGECVPIEQPSLLKNRVTNNYRMVRVP